MYVYNVSYVHYILLYYIFILYNNPWCSRCRKKYNIIIIETVMYPAWCCDILVYYDNNII